MNRNAEQYRVSQFRKYDGVLKDAYFTKKKKSNDSTYRDCNADKNMNVPIYAPEKGKNQEH